MIFLGALKTCEVVSQILSERSKCNLRMLGLSPYQPDVVISHALEVLLDFLLLVRAALCRRFRRNSRRPLFLVINLLLLVVGVGDVAQNP